MVALDSRPHLGAVRHRINHAGGQQKVDPERSVGEIAHRPDAPAHLVRLQPRASEDAHAAGLADGRDQFGRGPMAFHAHAGEKHRKLDLQIVA